MFSRQFRNRIRLEAWERRHAAIGHLRRMRNYVRRCWSGDDPSKDSSYQVIYVQYDRAGTVHDYVIEQLRQLVAAKYRITFVSNSKELNDANLAVLRSLCRQVI